MERAAAALRNGAGDDRVRALVDRGLRRLSSHSGSQGRRDAEGGNWHSDVETELARSGPPPGHQAVRRGELVGVKGQLAKEEEQVHDEHTDSRIGRSQA